MNKMYAKLLLFAVGLAVIVVVLGAYTRLADAGLGCPDWPGCYGHVLAPLSDAEITAAEKAHPWRPVEIAGALKEMTHRYFAGGLIVTVLVLNILAWRARRERTVALRLAAFVMGLILLQALLGMWTVTWKLKPIVVTAHLLGGFATLALLWLMALKAWQLHSGVAASHRGLSAAAIVGLIIVVLQITLGGWTSANYAALACPDFPTCQTRWWPAMDFSQGFVLWRGIGQNYEFGVLDANARTAIHIAHRIGALVTVCYLTALGIMILRSATLNRGLKNIAAIILAVLLIQVALGIANIIFALPLAVATAHNAVGAMLLLSMVTLVYALQPLPSKGV